VRVANTFHFACADGTRLSGTLDRVEGDRLVLECSAAVGADSLEALALPVAAVRGIRFLHKAAPPTRSGSSARRRWCLT